MKVGIFLLNEKKILEQEKKALEQELQHLPEGSLECRKKGESDQWYQYLNGKSLYISKKDILFAQKASGDDG